MIFKLILSDSYIVWMCCKVNPIVAFLFLNALGRPHQASLIRGLSTLLEELRRTGPARQATPGCRQFFKG